jgi:hypothetical protein
MLIAEARDVGLEPAGAEHDEVEARHTHVPTYIHLVHVAPVLEAAIKFAC